MKRSFCHLAVLLALFGSSIATTTQATSLPLVPLKDGTSSWAVGAVPIDSTGAEKGTSANPIIVSTTAPALTFTATTITLTANQAAGTDPIIAANTTRKALQFRAAADFEIALTSGQSAGMRIYASARDSLVGAECPLGALYLVSGSGLTTGSILIVWEA